MRSARRSARADVTTGDNGASAEDGVAAAKRDAARALERLAGSDAPIIAGPWTGEVGYELLYWIPLLRWMVSSRPEIADRLTVVSRGGTEAWYSQVAHGYLDVLELVSHDRYLRDRSPQKQRKSTDFERRLMRAAEERLALTDATWLHPSELYGLYFRAVKARKSAFVESVQRRAEATVGLAARYAPLDRDALPRPADAPDHYIAVRFYGRESFIGDDAASWASAVVDALRELRDVVVIGPGAAMDEHRDIAPGLGPEGNCPPEHNLARQTQLIAHADAFVGTYGGLSYLAPMFGREALAFSSAATGLQRWHEQLAQAVFAGPEWGSLRHVRTADHAPETVASLLATATRG